MQVILKIVLVFVIGLVAFGYYVNYTNEGGGEKFIGIGIIIFAFILLPLFIFHRYKGKDLSRYSIDNMMKKLNEDKNKKRRRG